MGAAIYVIDGNDVDRRKIGKLFSKSGYVVETFVSGDAFLAKNPVQFGCILLATELSGLSALDVQAELAHYGCSFPVIFLGATVEAPVIVRAIKSGAADFLVKPIVAEVLLQRVGDVLDEYAVLHERDLQRQQFRDILQTLSGREYKVFTLVGEGYSSVQIAEKLGLSRRTVDVYRSRIIGKTGASNLSELVRQATQNGLIA